MKFPLYFILPTYQNKQKTQSGFAILLLFSVVCSHDSLLVESVLNKNYSLNPPPHSACPTICWLFVGSELDPNLFPLQHDLPSLPPVPRLCNVRHPGSRRQHEGRPRGAVWRLAVGLGRTGSLGGASLAGRGRPWGGPGWGLQWVGQWGGRTSSSGQGGGQLGRAGRQGGGRRAETTPRWGQAKVTNTNNTI